MDNPIARFFRAVSFALIAVIGIAMALIFMVSTAVAMAILYLIAKLRGKPFGVRAYWSQRQQARPSPFRTPEATFKRTDKDVIDVEAREIR